MRWIILIPLLSGCTVNNYYYQTAPPADNGYDLSTGTRPSTQFTTSPKKGLPPAPKKE